MTGKPYPIVAADDFARRFSMRADRRTPRAGIVNPHTCVVLPIGVAVQTHPPRQLFDDTP
jgi:hypothetical protein